MGGDTRRKEKMKNTQNKTRAHILWICKASAIAAIYVALTYLSMALGLDKGAIQIRFSEALVALAFFTPAAIPGLTVGCFLANLLTGCAPLDILLGPVATLIGSLGAYLISKMKNGKASRLLFAIPNIVANAIIVSFIVYVCYTQPSEQNIPILTFYFLTVGAGEIISCGVLGTILLFAAEKPLKKILQ